MLYLYFGIAILVLGIGFVALLTNHYKKKGLPIEVIPSGLIIAPIISVGMAMSLLFNPEVKFNFIKFAILVVLPPLYSYILWIAEKKEQTISQKMLIDAIFSLLIVLSLPNNTFFFKGMVGDFALPQWLDNLIIIPVIIYTVNSFRAKDDSNYDGFTSMFVSVMGVGLCALSIPYKMIVGGEVSFFAEMISIVAVIFFAFNRYPAKIPMTSSGSAPLVMIFVYLLLEFSKNGAPFVMPAFLVYIFLEDIFAFFKKMVMKIKYLNKLDWNSKPYYAQLLDRNFRIDVALTYIMKWHVGLILVAYIVADSRINYVQSSTLVGVSGACIMYMVSKLGVKIPTLRDLSKDVYGLVKEVVNETKSKIKDKTDGKE